MKRASREGGEIVRLPRSKTDDGEFVRLWRWISRAWQYRSYEHAFARMRGAYQRLSALKSFLAVW